MSEKLTQRHLDEAVEEDLTDWPGLDKMTDAELETSIADDPDWNLSGDDVPCARGVIQKCADGLWRWELIDRDGHPIAASPTGYIDRDEVDRAITRLKSAILDDSRRLAA